MTTTVIAQVTDASGHAAKYQRAWGRDRLVEVFAHPAASFDDIQSAPVPVTVGHGGHQLGTVGYLEHNLDSSSDLTAVCVLDDGIDRDDLAGLYASADVIVLRSRDEVFAERCQLAGLAIVAETAGVGARTLRAFEGDYRNGNDRNRWGWRAPAILKRAAEATPHDYRWSRPTTLTIHRPLIQEHRTANQPPTTRPLEYRPGVILAIR